MTSQPLSHYSRRQLLLATAAATLATSYAGRAEIIRAYDEEPIGIAISNNRFAFDLYEEIRSGADGNLIFSPLSISLALAMVYVGAAGTTATQMAEILHVVWSPEEIGAPFRDLVEDLVIRGAAEEDDDAGTVARALHIADALWGEETYPFSPTFMDRLESYFDAGLRLVSFQGDPEGARDEINDWVAEQTADRIENIVPEGAISSLTRLVLVNAIWFYGAWEETFSPLEEDRDFTLLDDMTVAVPFMSRTASTMYASGRGYQAIEISYAGSGFAMTILFPDEGSFSALEEELTPAKMDATIGEFMLQDVRLTLPKFSFEFGSSLSQILQQLGMVDAFDGVRADFSGMMADEAAEPLVISDVLHKAFIAVDENGTEAAAATAVILEVAMAPAPEDEPIEVIINRPFIFAIRDTKSGALLFLGRVLNPGEE